MSFAKKLSHKLVYYVYHYIPTTLAYKSFFKVIS